MGVLVLNVFIFVVTYNLLPQNRESNAYYVKVGETMSAKIVSLSIVNGTLSIETSGDAVLYCVKSTRSTLENNNLCWKKIENNNAVIQIYDYKQYYVWIKDNNGNVSSPMSINAKKDNGNGK